MWLNYINTAWDVMDCKISQENFNEICAIDVKVLHSFSLSLHRLVFHRFSVFIVSSLFAIIFPCFSLINGKIFTFYQKYFIFYSFFSYSFCFHSIQFSTEWLMSKLGLCCFPIIQVPLLTVKQQQNQVMCILISIVSPDLCNKLYQNKLVHTVWKNVYQLKTELSCQSCQTDSMIYMR